MAKKQSFREMTYHKVLFMLLITVVVEKTNAKCHCNFGGLCLDGRQPVESCHCEEIGKGIYEKDCRTLKNHCLSASCENGGTCVQILGGYFCKCLDGYYGQKCEFTGRKLISEEMYIFYQVQLAPNDAPFFVIIYDPTEEEYLRRYNKTSVVYVTVTDGRQYNIRSQSQMKKNNWKQICMSAALNFPDYYDETVCDLLPDKEKWAWEFSPLLGDPLDVNKDMNIYDKGTLVGRVGNVKIAVKLKNNNDSEEKTLNYHNIRVFTYYVSRVPNNCLIEFKFRGCSANSKYPRMEPRSSKIRITPFIRKVSCIGTLTKGYKWYLQQHVDNSTEMEDAPIKLDGLKAREIFIPPLYFRKGVHMIQMEILLEGNPPRYGGASKFSKIGRCWLQIELGPVSVRVKYGRSFTATCYAPLKLLFVTSNPSYYVSELQFDVSCNHTTDAECETQSPTVPQYTKLVTPCDSFYSFKIRAHSKISTGEGSMQEIESQIRFMKSETETHFECQFNCYPVDPKFRTIGYVRSTPYYHNRITWNITANGREVVERDGDIYAFYPLSASRIFRINGYRFIEPNKVQSKVRFLAKGIKGYFVLTDTFSNNLLPYMRNFSIQPVSNRTSEYAYKKTDLQPYIFLPIRYRIYQINSLTRSCLVVLETNHPSKLKFNASWNDVQLCITDAKYSNACTNRTRIERTTKRKVNLDVLREQVDNGDASRFLTYSVLYLYNGMEEDASKPLKWQLNTSTRIELLKLALKIEETRTRDLAVVGNIISMISFSKEGNEAEELHTFVDETDGNSTFTHMLSWMEMRKFAMKVFLKAAKKMVAFGLKGNEILLNYTYGDALDELFYAWSLAHVQSNLVKEFQENVRSKYEDFFFAELSSLERSINKLVTLGIHEFMRALAWMTRLFYGLRTFGKRNTRGWVVTTSYRGIIVALNKSIIREHKENLDGYTDYVFGPPANNTEWFEYTSLILPPPIEELDSDQFSLVVLMAKNRQNDVTVTPFMYLRLIRKGGSVMTQLPGSGSQYRLLISLPKMVKGKVITNTSDILINYTIRKPKNYSLRYNYYSVYKVTLPTTYVSWKEFVYVGDDTPLKVKIKFTSAPDIHETASEPVLDFEYDKNIGLYKAAKLVSDSRNESFGITSFYLGLLLPKPEQSGTILTVHQHSDVNVCVVQETDGSDYEENCQGAKADRIDVHSVKCRCRIFGLVFAKSYKIRRTKMFMGVIEYVSPKVTSHDEIDIIPGLFALFAIATIIVAFFVDRRRRKLDLHYVEDAYPGEKNLVVVGVYTSVRLLSGTNSTVAIKIVGVDASSRVHLLQAKRKKSLRMGHDDWFVITTKTPLGKITDIIVWHNFFRLSDWHCSQIFVYEIATTRWYQVKVERWFCVRPSLDDSKMVSLKMKEIESVEGVFLSLPYTFSTHYINELRNCHILMSLFYLRRRSLTSVEHRCWVMLIKVIAMGCMTYAVEKYMTILLYGRVLDPEAARGLLAFNTKTLLLAVFIVLFSAPFTHPIQLLYRSNYKSKLLQKKITNPIYIQLAKPEDLVTTSQLPHADDNPPLSPQVKKVGFQLNDPDEQPFRRVTRLLSNVIQKRIAWTRTKKASLGKTWKKAFLTLFGPAQFRCVNISSDIFLIKTRQRTLKIRIMAACTIIILIVAMFLILNFTTVYNDLEVIGFLLLLAILVDIIILDPIFILLHSLWMFYGLQSTNKESYLWNEDTKLQLPTPLNFVKYSKTVTKKDYKPLVTADIEKKIQRQRTVSRLRDMLIYFCSLLGIFCATIMIDHDFNKQQYYTTKGMTWQISEPLRHLRKASYHVDEVDSPKKVADYIVTSLASFVLAWYNGKTISINYDHGWWARDLVSKPIGATRLTIQFLPRGAGGVRVKKILTEYFEYAVGYVKESSLEREEISLGGYKINYMKEREGWIVGKTDDYYPVIGHNLTLPIVSIREYYSSLINVLNDVLDNTHIHIPRAIIYTANYMNPYARQISTVDAIFEFLPSGACTAKIHMHTIPAYEMGRGANEIFSAALIVLVVIHCCLTVNEAVKHEKGIILYFLSLYGIFKLIVYLLSISLLISLLATVEEDAFDAVAHVSEYEYIDLHSVYEAGMVEAGLELTMLCALILDTCFTLWRRCRYDRLKQTMTTQCVHLCSGLFLLQLYLFVDLNVCSNSMDASVSSMEVSLLLKEGTSMGANYGHILLIITYCTLFIFQKTTAAVFLANYFIIEKQKYQESSLKEALEAMRHFPKRTSIKRNRPSEAKSKSMSSEPSGSIDREESSHSFRTNQPKKYNLFW